MQTYLVGGAIRDHLLNIPVREKDYVVVGATESEMLASGFIKVGKDFPVFLHPDTKAEYALARTERKVAPGYAGFNCYASAGVSLEEDLRRRDLTINAIAQSEQGDYIDPYGGFADLENRQLRHISEAFVEDPLRILRVARFAAKFEHLGFSIASETRELMYRMVCSGELKALVPERVWQETLKALQTPAPAMFFEVLRQIGALSMLFPELHALFGVPANPLVHPEIDSGVHTLMCLQSASQLSNAAVVRFATLVHDLGKALTPYTAWPKHPKHEPTGVDLVEQFCDRLRVPNQYRTLAMQATRYHGWMHDAFAHDAKALVQFFHEIAAFKQPERLDQLITVAEADHRGRLGFDNEPYPQGIFLKTAFEHAAKVCATPFIAQNLQGKAINQAMRQEQIAIVQAFIEDKT